MDHDRHGQPVGGAPAGWSPRQDPPRTPMQGRFCIVEPLMAARHAADLHAAHARTPDDRDWTYLPDEKPADRQAFDELGYRRCEWKCGALNGPSRAAARRHGFRFEGCSVRR